MGVTPGKAGWGWKISVQGERKKGELCIEKQLSTLVNIATEPSVGGARETKFRPHSRRLLRQVGLCWRRVVGKMGNGRI